MNALTATYLIILPVTAACYAAPRCSRCQFAHSPADRCGLECESRTGHSQEAAIRSIRLKTSETQQCQHRTSESDVSSLLLFSRAGRVTGLNPQICTSVGPSGAHGSCSDESLVLAVKWSICRYVCLPHRKPLTHSLLLSPDERKHLIYSGFKDTSFPSFPHDFASQEVVSFPLISNQTGFRCHCGISHESMVFSRESDTRYQLFKETERNLHLSSIKSSLKSFMSLFCWITVKCVTGCFTRALRGFILVGNLVTAASGVVVIWCYFHLHF